MPHGVRNVESSVQTASAQITPYPGKLRDISIVSDGANAGVARLLDGVPIVLAYDSGGNTTPTIGETITGATSGRIGILAAYTTASGAWGSGTAAGNLYLILMSGAATKFTNDEALNFSVSGNDNATANGTGTTGTGGTEIWRGASTATAGSMNSASFPDGRSFATALYALITNVTAVSVGFTDNT